MCTVPIDQIQITDELYLSYFTGHYWRGVWCHTCIRWWVGKPEYLGSEAFDRGDLQLGNLQQQGASWQRVLLDGGQHRSIWWSDQMDIGALSFPQLNCILLFVERPPVFIWHLLETIWDMMCFGRHWVTLVLRMLQYLYSNSMHVRVLWKHCFGRR